MKSLRPARLLVLLAFMTAVGVVAPPGAVGSAQEAPTDPHDLVPWTETQRTFSQGVDRIGVFRCEGADTKPASYYADQVTRAVSPWFEYHSRGRYQPVFVPQSEVLADDTQTCEGRAQLDAADYPDLTAAIVIVDRSVMPQASLGYLCSSGGSVEYDHECPDLTTNPLKRRWIMFHTGMFDEPGTLQYDLFQTAYFMIHEVGHSLHWPHTFSSDPTTGDYDTLMDVMSTGNGGGWDEVPEHAPTSATNTFNLYRSGWIDPDEVQIVGSEGGTFVLQPTGSESSGTRMVVIPDGSGGHFVLGARPDSPHDPVRIPWQGVDVFRVFEDPATYPSHPDGLRIAPHPDIPTWGVDINFRFDQPLPHLIPPGEGRHVGDYTVMVTARTRETFTIEVTPGNQALPEGFVPPSSPSFTDTANSVFTTPIEWMARWNITLGCNPPENTRFCPAESVSRQQMASFLVRALYLPTGDAGRFEDVGSDNPHRFDIAGLADAGITLGCNPPENTRYCPDQPVTRAQMASFLARGVDYLWGQQQNTFTDVDDFNPHRPDITAMARNAVTLGCNPPDNDRYCPDDPVTRGQMAAFLFRALETWEPPPCPECEFLQTQPDRFPLEPDIVREDG